VAGVIYRQCIIELPNNFVHFGYVTLVTLIEGGSGLSLCPPQTAGLGYLGLCPPFWAGKQLSEVVVILIIRH
jgi:hypothetical protein